MSTGDIFIRTRVKRVEAIRVYVNSGGGIVLHSPRNLWPLLSTSTFRYKYIYPRVSRLSNFSQGATAAATAATREPFAVRAALRTMQAHAVLLVFPRENRVAR